MMGPFRHALALGFAFAMPQAAAQAATVEASYSITLAGLTIGKASLSGVIEQSGYTLSVSASLTGLIGAVAKGSGSASSQGNMGVNTVLTNGFTVIASNGKQTRTVRINASSGSVRSISVEPPFEPAADEEARVPLRDAHKASVIDPLSALVMPARSADPMDRSNCERRLPVFDGTQRFDIVLSFAGIRQINGEAGYKGPALVCSARYVPVAGHRPSRRAIKFMSENRDIDTWLVPVNAGKAFMPYRISVKTMIGTSVIQANRFAVSSH